MADTKKNALAELAHWLECDTRTLETASLAQLNRIRKAQRIVAEMAKVSDGEWDDVCNGHPAYFCTAGDMKVQCCIGKCRAIAEEGAGDGK